MWAGRRARDLTWAHPVRSRGPNFTCLYKMVASFNLVPGQQYHIRLNSSTTNSTQGFAWRSVRILAPPGVDGRIELVDLSDPTGPREKSPYVANIIQVEGQSAPTPARMLRCQQMLWCQQM